MEKKKKEGKMGRWGWGREGGRGKISGKAQLLWNCLGLPDWVVVAVKCFLHPHIPVSLQTHKSLEDLEKKYLLHLYSDVGFPSMCYEYVLYTIG